MKVKLTVIFSTVLILLLFGACSSLPLPGSPTESLFVMTGEVDKKLGAENGRVRTVERVVLTLENMETYKTKTIVYQPGKDYVAMPLEPGRYRLLRKVKVDMSENPGGSWTHEEHINSGSPFLISEATVFISPIIFKMNKNGRGWFNMTTYTSTSTSNMIRKKAVAQVISEKRFKAWELYQMIGWELVEE